MPFLGVVDPPRNDALTVVARRLAGKRCGSRSIRKLWPSGELHGWRGCPKVEFAKAEERREENNEELVHVMFFGKN